MIPKSGRPTWSWQKAQHLFPQPGAVTSLLRVPASGTEVLGPAPLSFQSSHGRTGHFCVTLSPRWRRYHHPPALPFSEPHGLPARGSVSAVSFTSSLLFQVCQASLSTSLFCTEMQLSDNSFSQPLGSELLSAPRCNSRGLVSLWARCSVRCSFSCNIAEST